MISNDSFLVKPLFALAPPHVLEWALNELKGTKRINRVNQAAMGLGKGGHFDSLKSLCKESDVNMSSALTGAASGGHLHILKFWKDLLTDGTLLQYTSDAAAKYGHLKTLKWLSKISTYFYEQTCDSAAKGGKIAILKWLNKEFGISEDSWCFASEYAAFGGHFELLKWIEKKVL